ncbi:hypothetical protein B4110_0042 [Parageobacillus toebii]|uniref:Uncharacterized protein n=1 Tax=Parageobacillus toebii TaxID=153151 RepID=A0A150N6L3_9BACL|nr:hypothetical protein B4110_0042 [Parageobacillus toebii]
MIKHVIVNSFSTGNILEKFVVKQYKKFHIHERQNTSAFSLKNKKKHPSPWMLFSCYSLL